MHAVEAKDGDAQRKKGGQFVVFFQSMLGR